MGFVDEIAKEGSKPIFCQWLAAVLPTLNQFIVQLKVQLTWICFFALKG